MEIFIAGNVPSFKNSKIKAPRGLFMSKTCRAYINSLGIVSFNSSKKEVIGYVNKTPNLFIEAFKKWKKPDKVVIIGFHFVRGTKHTWDFINMLQLVADLLVAHDLIEDDNMDWFIPVPYKKDDKWYSYSKTKPGVYIKIIEE